MKSVLLGLIIILIVSACEVESPQNCDTSYDPEKAKEYYIICMQSQAAITPEFPAGYATNCKNNSIELATTRTCKSKRNP